MKDAGTLVRYGVRASAIVLLILLAARAALTIDPYFDSFAYHLPFAARLSGLCPKSCYQMGEFLEETYDGFPKLYDGLLGWVWRVTGSLQAAHLLPLLALILFCVYLRQCFHVPLDWAFVGLLAVPLFQIHVTSSYIDLPLNLAASTAILGVMMLARSPQSFGVRPLLLIVACLALVANSKYQMFGVAAAVGGALFVLTVALLAAGRRVGPFQPEGVAGWLRVAGFFAVAGALVGATAIYNAHTYGNPFYPLDVHVFGLSLPGPLTGMAEGEAYATVSDAWADVPSPLRWLASVLEIRAYDYRQLPWTYDQGGVPFDQPSFRMGGYFVTYVLFLFGFLACRLSADGTADRRLLAAVWVLTTLLAMFLPLAHNLRYYAFWPMVVLCLCLITVFDPRGAGAERGGARSFLGGGMLVALASVVLITGGTYLDPRGVDTTGLIRELGIDNRIAAVDDGAIVCVDPGWQPYTFLFASIFHPARSYSVLDGPIGPCTVTIPR